MSYSPNFSSCTVHDGKVLSESFAAIIFPRDHKAINLPIRVARDFSLSLDTRRQKTVTTIRKVFFVKKVVFISSRDGGETGGEDKRTKELDEQFFESLLLISPRQ